MNDDDALVPVRESELAAVEPADFDSDERGGMAETVEFHEIQDMVGETLYGVYWPTWRLQQEPFLKQAKLRKQVIQNYQYKGQCGVLLPISCGRPEGTTKILGRDKQVLAHTKKLMSAQTSGAKACKALFRKGCEVRKPQLKRGGKLTKATDAPSTLALVFS